MNIEIESLLLNNGASMIGFAKVEGLYKKPDFEYQKTEDYTTEIIDIPHYKTGISIILAYPKDVIKHISNFPTIRYYDAYYELNNKLDDLAAL